jgi:pimeloyl-ACP methyl ester carboxylesterase
VNPTPAKIGGPETRGVPQPAPARSSRLAYSRYGEGEPLVLLHGHGFSRRSWDPVIPLLSPHRDVIAVDLPGHGDSPRQPEGEGSAPKDLALAVAELIAELGIGPVHIAGNSLGGWVALELGRTRWAKTVTAVSPAGLWGRTAPRYLRLSLRQSRINARVVRRLAPDAPRTRLSKTLFIAQASGHPSKVPDALVRAAIYDVATAPGFRDTLHGLERRRFRDGGGIRVPVTVAFGSRDRVLLPGLARRRGELPAHTRWVRLPELGHLAMFDDPRAVADLILESGRPRATEPAPGRDRQE